MQTSIPCALMRGGTSKGLYFLASDLPGDEGTRERVLLAAMGSPDRRQIDGAGGAHPLTSKVAVVQRSSHPEADVDYLFLQVVVDRPEVSGAQNCGNILAGVGAFAIEAGLVEAADPLTRVRVHMVNSGALAVLTVSTPDAAVDYSGDARIDGVPGTAAPVPIEFLGIAGSSCGALLPTGSQREVIEGIEVTCIDNGMPVVVMRAADLGKSGHESPAELEADEALCARVEALRLAAGHRMGLGDVGDKTVPKLTLVSAARGGGSVATRTFIPHRVHEAIGVLGAVSVATACALPDSVTAGVARVPGGEGGIFEVEHPTGFFSVEIGLSGSGAALQVRRAALLRTARMLMRGSVFIPAAVWAGPA